MNVLTKNVTYHFNKKKDIEAIKSSATIVVPNGAPEGEFKMQGAGNSRCRGGIQDARSLLATKLPASAATPMVYPEGLQQREKQNTCPRLLPLNSLT